MVQSGWRWLAAFTAAFLMSSSALAQEDDFSFSPEEMSGDSGGDDELTFDVIDTAAAAKDVEASRRDEMELIRVIQRRPFLRRNRVELSPFLGTNINDPMVSQFVAGGTLNYHLTEAMSLGINGGYSLGAETDLFEKVIEDYELFPQVSKVIWYGTVHFQYAPIYGKFALFNTWIIPWDIYALLGAGWTQTELDGHVTLAAGAGNRYFMTRWFTLNLELRNHTYLEEYPGGNTLVNNLMFTAGVGFFLPTDFEYRTLK